MLATLSPLLTVADYSRVIFVVCEMITKVLSEQGPGTVPHRAPIICGAVIAMTYELGLKHPIETVQKETREVSDLVRTALGS